MLKKKIMLETQFQKNTTRQFKNNLIVDTYLQNRLKRTTDNIKLALCTFFSNKMITVRNFIQNQTRVYFNH